MTRHRAILLVEDNEDDAFRMRKALKEAGVTNPLYEVDDGEKAVDYLSGSGEYSDRERHPFPAILFLDLKLPLKSGLEVLGWIREREQMRGLVVVVLTSSEAPEDLKTAYRLGANSFLAKPPTSEQLVEMVKSFKWYWLDHNQFEKA